MVRVPPVLVISASAKSDEGSLNVNVISEVNPILKTFIAELILTWGPTISGATPVVKLYVDVPAHPCPDKSLITPESKVT